MSSKDVVRFVLCGLCFLSSSIIHNEAVEADPSVPQTMWNTTQYDELRKDLLKNYDRFARPSEHYNATVCSLGFKLTHIDISEEKSTMYAYGVLRMEWRDEKLKWDPNDYGGLHVIRMPSHELWKPDIYLYNSAVASPLYWSSTFMMLYSTGDILWIPPVKMSALCSLDMKHWPFDTHQCSFIIASYTMGNTEIDLQLYEKRTTVEVDLITHNNQWQVVETVLMKNLKTYACCQEGYPDITIILSVKRAAPAYTNLIVTPAFAIITCTLVTFWITPYHNGKLFLNAFAATIICMFLLYFTQQLPALGDDVPLIMSFYSSCLYLVCISMFESVIVIWIASSTHYRPLPWVIKRQFSSRFGTILGLGDYVGHNSAPTNARAEEIRDHQLAGNEQATSDQRYIIDSPEKRSNQQEWMLLAIAIDRIMFYIYFVIFILLAITHSL